MARGEALNESYPAVPESVPIARRALTALAAAAGAGGERLEEIRLAVSEALTNAVVHAYRDGASGQVRVVACALETGLLVVVRDYGCGMLPNPGSPGAGLGLAVIGALAGEMNIERPDAGGGTRIRIRFKPPDAQ
jgi:serine/threonine-protein kinase RsbW/stage II sporulation protein AB (anti-sigma F factor)